MAATATSTSYGFRLDTASLGRVEWVALGLAAITGVVHLYLYWTQEFIPFLLAGLGFFGAIGLVLLNVYRRALYLVGIPFTASQIAAWFVQGMPSFELGVFDKTVQVLLIVLLGYLFVTSNARTKPAKTAESELHV